MNPSSTILLTACIMATVHLTLGESEGKECSKNVECDDHSTCINGRCVDPCLILGLCGLVAECSTINHSPFCRCPPNYTGNPFVECTQAEPGEKCEHACGDNTRCKVSNGAPICSCLNGYVGDPFSGCRRECESSNECGSQGCCSDFQCYPAGSCGFVNIIKVDYRTIDPGHPCDPDPCEPNAICREFRGHAFCQCRYAPFTRLPESGCNPECSTKFDCPADKTCIKAKCVNSCPGDCSPNDECYVFNHKAKCRSKTFLPECTSNKDCSSDKACDGYFCVDPCVDHCVANTDCQIVNQQPICTCKPGYYKGPYKQCYREGLIVE